MTSNLAAKNKGHSLNPRLSISPSPLKKAVKRLSDNHNQKSNLKKKSSAYHAYMSPKMIPETDDKFNHCEVISSGEDDCEYDTDQIGKGKGKVMNNAVKHSSITTTKAILEKKN